MAAGVNDKRRVPCARKPDTHGFHPENEACSYCDLSRSVMEDMQPPSCFKLSQSDVDDLHDAYMHAMFGAP